MPLKRYSKNNDSTKFKKRRINDNDESDESGSDSNEEHAVTESESAEEEMSFESESSDVAADEEDKVEIDFSGFELAPEDHNGVRLLLQRLLLKNPVDLGEMTHYIIEQLDVGSVIKVLIILTLLCTIVVLVKYVNCFTGIRNR